MQKVIKVGSSAAVTIPKDFLEELGVQVGDKVEVSPDKKNRRFNINIIGDKAKLTGEFANWTDKFIDEYRPALEELKDK